LVRVSESLTAPSTATAQPSFPARPAPTAAPTATGGPSLAALAPASRSTTPLLIAAGAAVAVLTLISPIAGIGLLLGGALVVSLLRRPEAMTLAVVFITWLDVPSVLAQRGVPTAVAGVFPLLLVLPLTQQLLRGGKLRVDSTFLALVALLVVELISTLFSAYPATALSRLETSAIEGLVLYFLVLNTVRKGSTLRGALWMILSAAAALALITTFQKLTHSWTHTYKGFALMPDTFLTGQDLTPRSSGPFGDPNYYAQVLLVAVAIGLMLVQYETDKRLRRLATVLTGLILYAITLTSSRGAILGLVLVLIAMLFFGHVRARHLGYTALIVGLVIALVPSYRARILSIGTSTTTSQQVGASTKADLSVASRTGEIEAAGLAFLDHPLLGVGPREFPLYYQNYAARLDLPTHTTVQTQRNKGQEAQRVAPQIFVSQAAELGLIGLLAFCAVIFVSMNEMLRARRVALRIGNPRLAMLPTALLLGAIAYLATGLFLELAYERYFWLILALGGAAARIVYEQRRRVGAPKLERERIVSTDRPRSGFGGNSA
jgi:O-antigen ligase